LKWLAKSAVQGLLSFLPASERTNRWVRERTGRKTIIDDRFMVKLEEAAFHVRNYCDRTGDVDITTARVLEIGTGIYPIVPLAMWLCGASNVTTIDINPLCRADDAYATVKRLSSAARTGSLVKALPNALDERINVLNSISNALENPSTVFDQLGDAGIHFVHGRLENANLETGQINLFVSNNVFEHIPTDELRMVLRTCAELGTTESVLSHDIDLSDHYSHFDSDISPLNFLRYPDWVWRFFNNRLQYQNRLRAPDYLEIIGRSGWTIQSCEMWRADHELERINLARRFRVYEKQDVTVTRMFVSGVLREADSPGPSVVK
jgi:hypothetical protein